jgi:hypothetical protein
MRLSKQHSKLHVVLDARDDSFEFAGAKLSYGSPHIILVRDANVSIVHTWIYAFDEPNPPKEGSQESTSSPVQRQQSQEHI